MTATDAPMRLKHTPLRQLHKHVSRKLGERVDWLRIYIVNEEEVLLAGTCTAAATRRRVLQSVRTAAPGARLRNAIVVDELPPGLRPGTVPPSTRRIGR